MNIETQRQSIQNNQNLTFKTFHPLDEPNKCNYLD